MTKSKTKTEDLENIIQKIQSWWMAENYSEKEARRKAEKEIFKLLNQQEEQLSKIEKIRCEEALEKQAKDIIGKLKKHLIKEQYEEIKKVL